jgi:hypothetical protein
MPQPRLIRDYLAVLAAQLPAPIVEELADGLAETYQSYLRQSLPPASPPNRRWQNSATRTSSWPSSPGSIPPAAAPAGCS